MSIEEKLKELLKESGDIEITEINLQEECVYVLLPYETSAILIDLEGDTDEVIIESFKENVNHRLDDMVNHLNDCKF
ncbi:hypothetical protein [Paenibacillus donghaensis]|uniref:Uncharacterized protein n=1 Tax=Paenibacillus donghaensis TaxID=414771 RepID=A0A2Z2KHB1_9BACL|nr:hypothetical protein [Paenibacillus donghaensis]ASA22633.1 hypothetical protein B9T62_18675 [Paenibacillus donghaensis]